MEKKEELKKIEQWAELMKMNTQFGDKLFEIMKDNHLLMQVSENGVTYSERLIKTSREFVSLILEVAEKISQEISQA